MLNTKLIYKILGALLGLEATVMTCSLVMAFYYHEDDVLAFIISIILTIVAATILRFMGLGAENSLGRRDAYLLVTATWAVFSLFGSLPFLISGYIPNFTDAYFETMSGFSTTGASVIDRVEALPHGMLFWRSLTQWIGGLGIVFFTVAILPSLVGGNVKVFSAEATGPIRAKMHPRLSTTAKWIWTIYLLLTLMCLGSFYLAGMSVFDAANYAMTVTATGGFATHDASTGYFHSISIDYIAIFFMFLSGTSFTLLYMSFFKGKISKLFKNTEFKFYSVIILCATVVITYILMAYSNYDIHTAVRKSLFQVVSFMTTTGIFNDDAGKWPHITWVVLSLCMFFGGCAGSTSGGFKCIRGMMTVTAVRNELKRILHPKAVLPVKANGQSVPYPAQVSVMAFFILYMMMCFFTYFVMIVMGVDSTNSITIAISCASNVGPALGLEIGPTMSWTTLPDMVKWLLSVLMLMGRLEILTVIVLFTPAFWKDR
ncbi:MAG: TrkH family potassium uptake protein [Prevotella sp.]|nr:TrkH family potassium uptake protein [Prevotella sp.]